MAKAPFFLIVLLSAALIASWIRVDSLTKLDSKLSSKVQDLEAQLENTQANLLKEHVQEETALFSQQTLIAELHQRIQAQRQVVSGAQQRLNEEKNVGVGGSELPALRDKQKDERARIADLQQQLKSVRQQEVALRKSQSANNSQSSRAALASADQQLRQQIMSQQQQLIQMNSNLRLFQQNAPFNPRFRNRAAQLRAQIAAKRNSIRQLQRERIELKSKFGTQKNNANAAIAASLRELHGQEMELIAQLQRERAALQSLNRDVQSGVEGRKSRQAFIGSAQANLNYQVTKLQDLQAQLREAQAHLKRLGPVSGPQAGEGAAAAAAAAAQTAQDAGVSPQPTPSLSPDAATQ